MVSVSGGTLYTFTLLRATDEASLSGDDYSGVPTTLTFDMNTLSRTVSFVAEADNRLEVAEVVQLSLVSGDRAVPWIVFPSLITPVSVH